MKIFQHHPDGWIYVRGDTSLYQDTPDNFAKDLGTGYTGLPAGYKERIYDPANYFHVLGDGRNQVVQPIPWEDGDTYIEALDKLLEAQKTRLSVTTMATTSDTNTITTTKS